MPVSQSSGQILNLEPPEYKAVLLPMHLKYLLLISTNPVRFHGLI